MGSCEASETLFCWCSSSACGSDVLAEKLRMSWNLLSDKEGAPFKVEGIARTVLSCAVWPSFMNFQERGSMPFSDFKK